MTSPQHPQYHDPCRECRTQINELNRVVDSLTYQIKGIAGENDDSSDENKRLTSKIVELESKLADRERQFNELDGILGSTRRLFLSSNEYAEELIETISDLEHKLSMCKGCRTTDSILIAGLKKALDEASKQIEELYDIIHDFRVGYGASRMFVDAVLIRNLNGDIAELKKERDAYKESIELERIDRELLDVMLKRVNPIIKSEDYRYITALSGFLSTEMHNLCSVVIAFRRKYGIVGSVSNTDLK